MMMTLQKTTNKMPRYVKQKDDSSCGPIAVINTLKWLGFNISYRWLDDVRDICKWTRDGTSDLDLEKALKYFKVKKKRRIQPSLEDIDKHIDSGGAVILSYFNVYSMPGFKKDSGHFALCIGRTSRTYMMVNDRTNRTKNKRYRDTMKAILANESDGYKCWAWFITK